MCDIKKEEELTECVTGSFCVDRFNTGGPRPRQTDADCGGSDADVDRTAERQQRGGARHHGVDNRPRVRDPAQRGVERTVPGSPAAGLGRGPRGRATRRQQYMLGKAFTGNIS